ncbi:hypothetical protein H3C66_00265 [Patescibacteria group bacterium]|nr:hypothetical protein [Patescibacteria group bacterium]
MLLAQNFDEFNPLVMESTKATQLSTPGGIITELLRYIFPAAGLILFVMIVWGGFEMMTSSVAGKKDAGRQRVTTAVIGFLLLFATYWIAQLVEAVFGVSFLG